MKRPEMLHQLNEVDVWDVVVIGGGASGLGAALDATSRGLKTLLLEQHDFAKGTSSRSTKLVHGGVRYLQQGDISLVLEALRERGLMLQNAPHLVKNQSFVIPNYDWWGGPFYTIGLKVYDMMAGSLGLGASKSISLEAIIKAIPNLVQKGLRGGIIYQDGQFDDARMAISLAMTCADYGATLINYMKVTSLIKDNKQQINGLKAIDQVNGKEYKIKARVVVNATGVWADRIMKMDNPDSREMIRPSQGVHIVLDSSFLKSEHAIMIPHTSDGRVLFAVPWHNRVIVGTTDTPINHASLEPRALDEEVDFILNTASRYLTKAPGKKDIKSIFAGLRPLAKSEDKGQSTKEISRHHKIIVSLSGLVTIIGGKWTTYRKMAENAIDKAILIGGFAGQKSITENVLIHGYKKNVSLADPYAVYGSDIDGLQTISQEKPEYRGMLSDELGITITQLIWSVREEMAITVEDFLARRTRALFLDARESIEICGKVAQIMAQELDKDALWVENEILEYSTLARGYFYECND